MIATEWQVPLDSNFSVTSVGPTQHGQVEPREVQGKGLQKTNESNLRISTNSKYITICKLKRTKKIQLYIN